VVGGAEAFGVVAKLLGNKRGGIRLDAEVHGTPRGSWREEIVCGRQTGLRSGGTDNALEQYAGNSKTHENFAASASSGKDTVSKPVAYKLQKKRPHILLCVFII
jgi:hypothetical protein